MKIDNTDLTGRHTATRNPTALMQTRIATIREWNGVFVVTVPQPEVS